MTYLGLSSPILLRFNSDGILMAQFPQGPDHDKYKTNIYVLVYDKFGGFTKYEIKDPVYVYPDYDVYKSLINDYANQNPNSMFYKSFLDQSVASTGSSVINFASVLNSKTVENMTLESKNDSFTSQMLKARNGLINDISNLGPSSIGTLKVISSGLAFILKKAETLSDSSFAKSLELSISLIHNLNANSDGLAFEHLKDTLMYTVEAYSTNFIVIYILNSFRFCDFTFKKSSKNNSEA